MIVYNIYSFKTSFYSPKYKEFYNLNELKCFIQNFDFMKSHKNFDISVGLPEFQLGHKFGILTEEGAFVSEIKWGPKFIVAKFLRKDKNGNFWALVPMDDFNYDENGNVNRVYREIRFNKGMADAVLHLNSLSQVWPKKYLCDSVMEKFFKQTEKNNAKIRKAIIKER